MHDSGFVPPFEPSHDGGAGSNHHIPFIPPLPDAGVHSDWHYMPGNPLHELNKVLGLHPDTPNDDPSVFNGGQMVTPLAPAAGNSFHVAQPGDQVASPSEPAVGNHLPLAASSDPIVHSSGQEDARPVTAPAPKSPTSASAGVPAPAPAATSKTEIPVPAAKAAEAAPIAPPAMKEVVAGVEAASAAAGAAATKAVDVNSPAKAGGFVDKIKGLKNEPWMGKKGLAVAAAVVTLGAVAYGAKQLLGDKKEVAAERG